MNKKMKMILGITFLCIIVLLLIKNKNLLLSYYSIGNEDMYKVYINKKGYIIRERKNEKNIIDTGTILYDFPNVLCYYKNRNNNKEIWKVIFSDDKICEKKKIMVISNDKKNNIIVNKSFVAIVVNGDDGDKLYILKSQNKKDISFDNILKGMGGNKNILDVVCDEKNLYFSIDEDGIFCLNMEQESELPFCIYDAGTECQNLEVYKSTLFFDHGNYTEPPLSPFAIKSYSENQGVCIEIDANDIQTAVEKYLKRKVSYDSVFGNFHIIEGVMFITADDIYYNDDKKEKITAQLSCKIDDGVKSLKVTSISSSQN